MEGPRGLPVLFATPPAGRPSRQTANRDTQSEVKRILGGPDGMSANDTEGHPKCDFNCKTGTRPRAMMSAKAGFKKNKFNAQNVTNSEHALFNNF
jgi:hypothetical protein